MHPLPTIKKAYSLLREKEKQRGLVEHKITKRVYAMNVKRSDSTSPLCFSSSRKSEYAFLIVGKGCISMICPLTAE
jgi:hypothetical protein